MKAWARIRSLRRCPDIFDTEVLPRRTAIKPASVRICFHRRSCLIEVVGCLLTLIRRRLQFTHPFRDFVWLLLEWNAALSYSEVPCLVEALADFELYFALTLNTVFI
jgi:hypothetical protein